MSKSKIKRAGLDDLEALVDIGRRTFAETFGPHNTEENMRLYLSRSLTDGAIKSELENDASEFYFALVDSAVAGYMKIKYNSSVDGLKEFTSVEIERIYVLRKFQQSGLGKKLLERAVRLAAEAGYEYVWLGVWEHNANAIGFYEHLGFTPFGQQPFMLGNDLQTDIRMRVKLGP